MTLPHRQNIGVVTCGLALMLALCPRVAVAAEWVVAPSISLMGEYDTNARRQAIDEDLDVDKPVGDALVRARAGLQLSTAAVGGRLSLRGDLGLKRFYRERGQTMSVAQLTTSYARALPWGLTLTPYGRPASS